MLSSARAESTTTKPRVILATGEQGWRSWLAERLKKQGCQVLEVTTGREALSGAIAPLRLDLLIYDSNLADVSATEVITRVRRASGRANVPIVIVSEGWSVVSHEALLSAGATDVLQAGIGVQGLASGILKYIRAPLSKTGSD